MIPPLPKRIVILTGADVRHTFFRKYMASYPGINVLRSYMETSENLLTFVEGEATNLPALHLQARNQSEHDFFQLYNASMPDHSQPKAIQRDSINNHAFYEEIEALKPDLIITYGCSIIKYPLLSGFKEKIINVHLGLSPYYRGAATNFWPLVNGEPEYVGATFMYIDAGIDTGDIIHQIRPLITWGDTPSSIGNRLIKEMTKTFAKLITHFTKLKKMPQPEKPENSCFYRKKDYSAAAVEKLYQHFDDGLIEKYLQEKEERLVKAPIVVNPVLR